MNELGSEDVAAEHPAKRQPLKATTSLNFHASYFRQSGFLMSIGNVWPINGISMIAGTLPAGAFL
ncbi:hypothetical protein [Cypionkella sp.]|uniref:hypothetical protein n=1 Tax=Cypionkella sp. TaxID=2811411 RepID=UPI002719FBAF|nr:hypothetical protein [Cypionkella sp.]MDO8984349.1 hypothetical protein [Cypionkella sp.]